MPPSLADVADGGSSGRTVRKLVRKGRGEIGGVNRCFEIHLSPLGILLRVEGGSDFYISADGEEIFRLGEADDAPLEGLDREIAQGPAVVLALALRGTWCLHAGAVRRQGGIIAFLGESGYGKSTLAGYLNRRGWQRAADDILPVTLESDQVLGWPHFPQLKLQPDEQPALHLPESLPLESVCLLVPLASHEAPRLERLSTAETVAALLGNTTGTRMFWPELLGRHLDFCTRAAQCVVGWRLIYPHRPETLPLIKELLESRC